MNDSEPRPGDRIAKLLARAGIASRREVERMIAEGRIALDGVALDTPATVLTSLNGITVDGHPVAAPEAARLFLYHKPTGLLVTERDPAGRLTIYDRLPTDLPRTVPVGRLDLGTEGLLLLTTDGGLKRQLELPATGVERTYRARAYGDVTQAMLEDLIEGIEIEGIRYGPIDANLERRTGANVWIELTLSEGKNREVRRVLEHLGLQVGRLIRTRYGPFVLGDLPPGEVGEVKQHDLVAFTKTLAGPRRAKGADLQSLVTVEPRSKAAKPAPAAPAAAPVERPAAEARPTRAPVRAAPARAAPAKPNSGWGSRTRPSRPGDTGEARPATGRFQLSDAGARGGRSDRQPRDRSGSEQRPQRYDAGDRPRSAAPREGRPATVPRDGSERPRSFAPRGDRPAAPYRDRSDAADRPRTQYPREGRPATGQRRDGSEASERPRSFAPRGDRSTGNYRDRPEQGDRPRGQSPRTEGGERSRAPNFRSDRPARTGDDRPRTATSGTLSANRGGGKGPAGGRGHPPRAVKPSRKGPPSGAPKGSPPRGKR
ncbi:pseudouridine synthase [Sphingomonas sp. Leaf339]|uniref:pseudouridine synthase n=1 Tax=Sphingomonas sp. Leaf339 TaxID=1736343 RepID=UPI000AFFB41C|nr:pseudouridine synthase [Sphingomonas sp. Leaf339]